MRAISFSCLGLMVLLLAIVGCAQKSSGNSMGSMQMSDASTMPSSMPTSMPMSSDGMK